MDLTRAKGLWSCRHRGPSPVDAATVTSPPIYRRISYWHVDSAYWISELRRSLRRDSRPSRLRKSLTTYASWSSSPSRAPPALSVSQQKISTLPTSYTTTFTRKALLNLLALQSCLTARSLRSRGFSRLVMCIGHRFTTLCKAATKKGPALLGSRCPPSRSLTQTGSVRGHRALGNDRRSRRLVRPRRRRHSDRAPARTAIAQSARQSCSQNVERRLWCDNYHHRIAPLIFHSFGGSS